MNPINAPQQPSSTPIFPLAQPIPEYRQARLAGRTYNGPTKNLVPPWSQVAITPPPLVPFAQDPSPIKGQHVVVRDNPSGGTAALSEQGQILGEKLKSKEAELFKLRERSTEQQKHLDALNNQRKTSEALIQNLKQQLVNLEGAQVANTEVQALRTKIAEREKETQDLYQEINRLRNDLSQASELEKQIQNYKQQMQVLLDQQKRMQLAVNKSESQVKELNSALERERQEKTAREKQIRDLEHMLEETIRNGLNPPQISKDVVSADQAKPTDLPVITKEPNAISGVVTDKQGKFIEDAVVLIKNISGQNLRALKTNQLGQFVITTSLPNGKYYVETTKTSHSFDVFEINLTGGIVPALSVKSHELTT